MSGTLTPLKASLLNVAATMAGMNFGSEAIFQSCEQSGGCAKKEDELKPSSSIYLLNRWDGYTTSAFSMLFLIFWVAALIMAIWAASKFSKWNANDKIKLLAPGKRATIVNMIASSFALFWVPGVNIILSSVLTHMVRTARAVAPAS